MILQAGVPGAVFLGGFLRLESKVTLALVPRWMPTCWAMCGGGGEKDDDQDPIPLPPLSVYEKLELV